VLCACLLCLYILPSSHVNRGFVASSLIFFSSGLICRFCECVPVCTNLVLYFFGVDLFPDFHSRTSVLSTLRAEAREFIS